MNQKTSTSKIEELLSFPEDGDIVSGVKVSSSKLKIRDGKMTYRICLPQGTRRADVPNILRAFYTTGMITIDGVDHAIQDHNHRIKPTRSQTIITGSASVIPLSMTNPVQKTLTALEDFNQEYSKMEMAEPGTYFRVFPYRGFDGPAFRSKLFSFVSNMGENYGYCDAKKIYHRRASLVMPKIKITKAPPDAKMFYHTHPKRDEPSLSSADDYLVYFDMSHKPLNIRHFYTVMADRMDYFHVVPKHSKKKDYVKINEDKFLEEVDNQIDEAGKRLDEKLPNETYEDNLYYCERVTREVVKFLNKKYGKYFTITYKCHYKVKKNPDKPTGSDLHLDDEFIAKGLNDIKSGKYSWPEFNSKTRPHEEYAYWHSRYFSLNRDARGVGYTGLMPGDMRRLEVFLYDKYRGSNYTYDDILGILCLSYDIRVRDSKIRDGSRNDSRITDILDFLEITDEVIREDIMLMDSIVAAAPYGELSESIGTHRFIIPLADFSMKSIEAMQDVKKGKKGLDVAKYEINVRLKEKMAKAVAKSLGEANEDIRNVEYGEPDPETGEREIIKEARTVPVYGHDGVVQKDRINPPIEIKKVDYRAYLPVEIFDNPELLKEIFEKFKKEGKDVLTAKNQYNIAVPVENTAVSMKISISSGSVEFFYPSVGFERTVPAEEAVVSAFRKLIETLNDRGFEIRTDDIAIGTAEPMRNPNDGMIISISGLVSPTKKKITEALEKRLGGEIVRTYTTKALKEYEKRSNLVEVTDEVFSRMATNGDLVVVTNSLDGSRRGYLHKDFLKSKYLIVDSMVADLPFLLATDPGIMSFYLQPTNSEAEIKKIMMEHVSPQEAKRIAELATDKDNDIDFEVDYVINYDLERESEALEEIFQSIPKQNPGPDGSVFFPGNGSNYYLTARTIPITALQGDPYRNPSVQACPAVTQNLEMNTRNRNSAIQADYIQYGPLNLADEEYWVKAAEHWKTTVDVAKESNCSNCVAFDISPRMLECMPGSVQEDGQLGMCWMHNFKCHSARTCYTWAAGGPITEDSVSYDWQERSSKPKENPKKKIQVRIQESTNPEKKLMAIFTKPNGKTKTTHFGARGMSDYTQHKDPKRQKNYLARHGKMGENWDDPTTAGALSRWILWGKPSLRESFNDFKKRFNLEGVMAVTNTKMNPRIPKKYEGQDPSEHSDLYTDEDPEGTIQGLGFKDKATAKKSIQLIKKADRTHAHKIQAAMAMEQRARFHPHATKGIKEAQKIYAAFIEEMKEKTKRNPSHCPIEAEARRAATDPSFKHHKWYVKHHLDYVMAIMKRMPKVMGNWDKQMVDMVWMHDYPKMMGKGQDLSVVNDLLTTHRGEDYAYQVVHQLHLMERLKKSDWNPLTEYSMVAANLSTADALAHYYGPFFQIYIDENPDMSMEEIKKSNRQKLAKDKLKLRAGPMKDGLDSIKFQYKGRKVRILGNEHIKALIEKKNPSKTPEGRKIPKKYLKGLNKEEMAIAAKEIDKGYKYDIDDPEAYEYWKSDIKATARGYKTVPSKYKKKFIEMYGPLPEEGKFLDKMAKATKIKKSILEKVYDKGLAAWRGGHRPGVQQHQWAAGRVYSFVTLGNTVKKGKKKMPDYSLAVEAGLVKKNPSKYREAAGGIVMKGDRILLLRRSTKETSKHGMWEFPGGKLEEGETAEEAAIIETQEESGLDVVVKGKAGEHIDHRKEKVYHAFFVEPANVNQEVKLSEEHDKSMWVTIDEALAMEESKLSHHARHFLEQMVRNNPPRKVIILSGASGSGKSTIAREIAKNFDTEVIPTYTTRPLRPNERDRVSITKEQFKKKIDDDEFIEYELSKNDHHYGRLKSDFDSEVSVIEVNLAGANKYMEMFPDSLSIYLKPDVSGDELKKRLIKRGGMSEKEAEQRAKIASGHAESAERMDFDLYKTTTTGKFSKTATEVIDWLHTQIAKPNPGWRHGTQMENDPFEDENWEE